MKKKYFTLILLIFLMCVGFCAGAYAQDEETNFYANPTPESFRAYAKIGDVTAEDLLLLNDYYITLEDFQLLPSDEQAIYLLNDQGYSSEFALDYLETCDFSTAGQYEKAVAEMFFAESSDSIININNNPDMFRTYLYETENIVLYIDDGEGITGYSSDGWLQGKNGKINIKDFAEDYEFWINPEGEIILLKGDVNTQYTFKGTIQQNRNGGIMLMGKGSFNGFETQNIYNLKIDSHGNIQCTAQKFGNLEFIDGKPQKFTYNIPTKRYTLKDAYLSAFPDLPITGVVGIEQESKNLFVGRGDKVSVGEITVKNENTNYVYLKFNLNFNDDPEYVYNYDPEKTFLIKRTTLNEVIFNRGGTVSYSSTERSMKEGKGGEYSISLTNGAMLAYEETFGGTTLYEGYFTVPATGYSLGEESESLKQFQQYFTVSQSGIYDEATQAAVREWQRKYNIENPEATIREDGILDTKTRNLFLKGIGTVTVWPHDGSQGMIYSGKDSLAIHNVGPVEIGLNHGKIAYNGEEIKGSLQSMDTGLPLTVNVYSKESNNNVFTLKRDNSKTSCSINPSETVENSLLISTDHDATYSQIASIEPGANAGEPYSGELIYSENTVPYVPDEIRGNFGATLAYFSVPDAEQWSTAISNAADQFVKEFNLPAGYDKYLERYIASEITQETNFGESEKYIYEYLFDISPVQLLVDTKGYVQVDPERAVEAANEVGAEAPFEEASTVDNYLHEYAVVPAYNAYNTYRGRPTVTTETGLLYHEAADDLHTPEGAALAGGRYVSLLVNQYVYEQGLDPDDPASVQLVASAYNAGRYTPRNAQVQQMLNDLGYTDAEGNVLKTDGTLGGNSQEALYTYASHHGIDTQTAQAELSDTSKYSFDSSTIYTTLSEEWMQKTGSPYTYAKVPDVRSAAQHVSKYADSVSHIYERFTEK